MKTEDSENRGFTLMAIFRPAFMTAILGAVVLSVMSTARAEGQTSDWRNTVRDFAEQNFKHPAWGYSHSVRDYFLARELAMADNVMLDDDVLFAAAYLHDMGAFSPLRNKEADHADEAARLVDTVLNGTNFPMEKIEAVRSAIRTHMYDRDPVGPEAIYLHDADALDWLGSIGVARIIALGDGSTSANADAVKMLDENLTKVPPRIFSKSGRARVPQREMELRRFLDNLRLESNDLRDL